MITAETFLSYDMMASHQELRSPVKLNTARIDASLARIAGYLSFIIMVECYSKPQDRGVTNPYKGL